MTTTLDPLGIRRRLGRRTFGVPAEFGPDGWKYDAPDGSRVIVTAAPSPDPDDPRDWWHASISHPNDMPTYADLVLLHAAVWPNGWAYQVFAPPEHHVNIHAYALHLWGRPDGSAELPNFGASGSI